MPPSYAVTSTKAVLIGLGQERDRSLQTLEAQATDIEKWLQQQVETYCSQVLQRSYTEQPPAKKQKLSSDDELNVMALRVKDLQKELKERGLDSQGLKQELRQRLLQALAEEKQGQPNTDNNQLLQLETIDLTDDEPPGEPMELGSVDDAADDDENKDTAVRPEEEVADKRKPVKRSRSPLKIVQVGVQSAVKKMLSKNTWSPVKASGADDSGQASSRPDVGGAACSKETEDVGDNAKPLETEEPPVGTAHSSANEESKSVAPSIAASAVVPLSLSTGSLTGGLKSNNVKAKNEARMAKLAEIRGKSKPAALGKLMTEPKAFTSTLSSLKAKTAMKDGKRNELAAKIRAKASNLRKLQDTASVSSSAHAPPKTSASKADPPASQFQTKESRPPAGLDASPHTSSSASLRSPLQSPMDTYEMSDREEEEEESEDDSDCEQQIKKRIPSWAQREFLRPALEQQFVVGRFDPDEIFGEVETCNLAAIFEKKKKRYHQRTSSGNWGQDRATTFEKLAYKRTMQFSAKA